VPRPIKYYENVLIMEYVWVGDNFDPAPALRTSTDYDPQAVYKALREAVKKMVKGARLVHGDLSEYNVLIVKGKPVIIDVSQAIVLDHPQSREYLARDAKVLSRFFEKKGITETADELYAYWTRGVNFKPMTRKERREEEE
jgi:RIO kinase 1